MGATNVKVNGQLYPATVFGRNRDADWDGRESKAIRLEMTYEASKALFTDDTPWSILHQDDAYQDPETGETVTPPVEEYDNSDFSVAGPITDTRDGMVTVKMGRPTAEELLAVLLGEG